MTKEELRKSLDFVNEERERLKTKTKEQSLLLIDYQDMEQKLEDYKSRIEKAVEYVDVITNKSIYESGYGKGTAITICKEYLLNILNGRSDE